MLVWNRLPRNRSTLGRTRTSWEAKTLCAQVTTECGGQSIRLATECMGCEVKIARAEDVEGKFLPGNVSRVNKRCHKNVVALLDFRAAGSLLVAAESTPASRLDRAFGS
jgi:hypothetical protein